MSKKALIVDDSRSACQFLAKLLAERDVDSDSVNSAEDALDYLRSKKPDVIFLDHNMPGMDGLETVKIIKSNPETATIPVLMYTTEEGEVYLGQARALGAVDVLIKDSVHERLEESLAKLGMGPAPAVGRFERRKGASPETPDWESLLARMQAELSRQMYLILAEEQIAHKGQMRWLAGNVKGNLEVASDEMTRRLEARQELRWEQQMAQSRRGFRVVTTLLVLLLVAALGGVWWQQQYVSQLAERYAASASADQRRWEEMRALVEALSQKASPPLSAPIPAATVTAPVVEVQANAQLLGGDGEAVGRLLGTQQAGKIYEGLSESGYVFNVNARGEIGLALERRYFAAANCVGDPLVDAQPGIVFRDANRQLWFTALDSQPLDLQPLSTMDEAGNCQPVETSVAALRVLLLNEPALTGLSAQDEPVILARP